MKYFLRTFLLLFLTIITFVFVRLRFESNTTSHLLEEVKEEPIPKKCICVSRISGKTYDFCYKLPENNVRGKRFNCKFVDHWDALETESSSKFLNPENESIPTPVFITAFSINYWKNGLRLVRSIRELGFHEKIVVYDLGIYNETVKILLEEACNVEVRNFDFHKYPKYVQNLREYRWKPIIIAQTLVEFGAIWYLDASIVIKKKNLSHVYELLNCQRNRTRIDPIQSVAERDERENLEAQESGWDQETWIRNLEECQKGPYLLHSFTGHGIYPVTNQKMYEFLPTNFSEIKKQKAKMYEAGFVYAIRTEQAIVNILKWYMLCGLEEQCMAPENSNLICKFEIDRFTHFANCHRYDQSAINLILSNQFFYDRHFYTSQIVDFFEVQRDGIITEISADSLRCI